jgi:hypothetical protein
MIEGQQRIFTYFFSGHFGFWPGKEMGQGRTNRIVLAQPGQS